ncbi:MAG: tetratricopeptide repeat protein [Nitrospinae bacterium]|nr:tetratricopeptide repeat protein [Nitrospinota bacterium]
MIRNLFLAAITVLTLAGIYPAEAVSLTEIDRLIADGDTAEKLAGIESQVRAAIQQSPASGELYLRLAQTYYNWGKLSDGDGKRDYFSRCLAQAEKAVSLQDRFAAGYYIKGVCLGRLGEIDGIWESLRAIDPFKQTMETALKIDPGVCHGGPHRALGRFYYQLPFILGGSFDKSITHLREAVRLGPRYPENYFFLAESYYAKGEYPLAREALTALMKNFPESRGPREDLEVPRIRERARQLLGKIETEAPSGHFHAQGTENP